jgi:hypothetical protein
MGYVYIQYNSKDRDAAFDIVIDLETVGVKIWLDVFEIKAGENWNKILREAYSKADAIIQIVSIQNLGAGDFIGYSHDGRPTVFVWLYDDLPNIKLENSIVVSKSDPDYVAKIIAFLPETTITEQALLRPNRTKPQPKEYVFISYSIQDIEFVEKFRRFFAKKGYAYWDYQEAPRKYEMPFHLELEEAIQGAKVVVSVVSPAWKLSKWAAREYLFAEDAGKTNFVCIVREVGSTLIYADRTFIEFFTDEDKGFNLLDKALRREGLID